MKYKAPDYSNRDEYVISLRKKYRDSLYKVLNTEEGKIVIGSLLEKMGLFEDVYVTNAGIYGKAALNDFARNLSESIDEIDFKYMVEIKQELKNRKERLKELSSGK